MHALNVTTLPGWRYFRNLTLLFAVGIGMLFALIRVVPLIATCAVWELPQAQPAALAHEPREYPKQMVAFFDQALKIQPA